MNDMTLIERRPVLSYLMLSGFGIALALLAGCNYNIEKNKGEGALNVVPGEVPSFNAVLQSVLKPKCASCHSSAGGNPAGVNLETYESVVPLRNAVRGVIDGNPILMPPRRAAPLTDAEKRLLITWLDAGAPRDGVAGRPQQPSTPGGSAPAPVPPTPGQPPLQPPPAAPPRFAEVYAQVIGPRCATCHGTAGGNRAGINLETYQNVIAELSLIDEVVATDFMPPRRAGPLTRDQKDLLARWIAAGAPQ